MSERRAGSSSLGAFVLGIPNRGRLHSECLARFLPDLAEQGMKRSLYLSRGSVTVLLARSTDLPKLLHAGIVDAAITGTDYVIEAGLEGQLEMVSSLDLEPTRISIIAPYGHVAEMPERPIMVSQYPAIARACLDGKWGAPVHSDAQLVPIDGAAEMYLRSGLADFAIDAVQTGDTMSVNSCFELSTLFPSVTGIFTCAVPASQVREAVTGLQNHV